MNNSKSSKWYGKMGHCPLCGGLCSEQIPTPCSKCHLRDPKEAEKWFKAHSSRDYGGSMSDARRIEQLRMDKGIKLAMAEMAHESNFADL